METKEEAERLIAGRSQEPCPHGGGAACPVCVEMCQRKPCWPTPIEALALIQAGYGDKLMVERWNGSRYDDANADIMLLSPAVYRFEGDPTGRWRLGRCTFLTPEGKCSLHDLGLKPVEGRLAQCGEIDTEGEEPSHHELVAATWNSPYGQALVESWRNAHPPTAFHLDPLSNLEVIGEWIDIEKRTLHRMWVETRELLTPPRGTASAPVWSGPWVNTPNLWRW